MTVTRDLDGRYAGVHHERALDRPLDRIIPDAGEFPKGSAAITRARLAADLVGYSLASAAALALDAGLLIGLAAAGLHYLAAATIGFIAGLALVYALSTRIVFRGRRARRPGREAVIFVAIGLAGLVLTQIMMRGFVEGIHLAPGVAKVPTAGAVFLFNFLARRALLFTPARPGSPA